MLKLGRILWDSFPRSRSRKRGGTEMGREENRRPLSFTGRELSTGARVSSDNRGTIGNSSWKV